jgi:hypothetical protein
MKKKVLFIGGSSYSGSTMLDMMLSNTKKGFSVGEIYALFRPYRPHHFNPLCGCGNQKCTIWLKSRDTGEDTFYKSIFEKFKDIEYIVDSSKDPLWINDQLINLSKQGIDAYNILIWKDPISFYASMIKRNRKGGIKAWVSYHRLYLTLIKSWITISYQELAQNPSASLRNLCTKTGILYQDGMNNYWEKQHHTIFGNDSAKIHLSESTNNYKIEDKKHSSLTPKEKSTNTNNHRSIYYKNDSNLVPKEIKDEITTNVLSNQIVTAISSGNIHTTESRQNHKVIYTTYEIEKVKLIANTKRYIGRKIGKYSRFY